MQSNPPLLPRYQAEAGYTKTRPVVQICSWFTGVLGLLSLIDGRSVGLLQILLAIIGIYASWDNVIERLSFITVYMVGCLIWTVINICYLCLLIAASDNRLRSLATSILSSNTFLNLAPSLDVLLQSLSKDLSFFTIPFGIVSVGYTVMASYWAMWFYNDVLTAINRAPERAPLLPSSVTNPNPRPRIVSFGSLSRPPSAATSSSRIIHPFGGKGFRLGASDS